MRKLAGATVAAVLVVGTLGTAAAEASSGHPATATASAAATGKFSIHTSQVDKQESSQKFKTTKAGKIQYTLTDKEWDHAVGFRLISCGSNWKSLTDWVDFKKNYGDYYTFKKPLKKGQCFRVQSGRSWAGWVHGKVKGNLKKA
ncbi:hypothetical protein [Streptomyces tricolor]